MQCIVYQMYCATVLYDNVNIILYYVCCVIPCITLKAEDNDAPVAWFSSGANTIHAFEGPVLKTTVDRVSKEMEKSNKCDED